MSPHRAAGGASAIPHASPSRSVRRRWRNTRRRRDRHRRCPRKQGAGFQRIRSTSTCAAPDRLSAPVWRGGRAGAAEVCEEHRARSVAGELRRQTGLGASTSSRQPRLLPDVSEYGPLPHLPARSFRPHSGRVFRRVRIGRRGDARGSHPIGTISRGRSLEKQPLHRPSEPRGPTALGPAATITDFDCIRPRSSAGNPLAVCAACWIRIAMWNQSSKGGVVIPASTRIDRRPGQPSVNAVTSVSIGSANGAKALSDQRRDVGVGLRDCSEHLPTSTRSFDIADANLQVTFALFAAADERRIHADSDHCCRSCWLVRGCTSKLRADPQRMVAQCLRAPTGVNGQQVLQGARSDAIGHQGGKAGLQFVQLRCRSATRWPTDARLDAIAGDASKPGKRHRHCAKRRCDVMSAPVLQVAFSLQAEQHGRRSPWRRLARQRPLVERSPEAASLLARSIPGSQYRQDLPDGRSLPNRCSGSGHRPPVAINRSTHALPFSRSAIDPTDRTSRVVIPPVAGHSRPDWANPLI